MSQNLNYYNKQTIIEIDEELAINFSKYYYLFERYWFYTKYTKEKKFLNLYKNSYKEFLRYKDIVIKQYLPDEKNNFFNICLIDNTIRNWSEINETN